MARSSQKARPEQSGETRHVRRTVSVHEKMQEARRRREALLHSTDAANSPSASTGQPDPAPRERALPKVAAPVRAEKPQPTPVVPEPRQETAPKAETSDRALNWVIIALILLLVALVSVAVLRLRQAPPPPPPVVVDQTGFLRPQGVGVPLLVSISRSADLPPVRMAGTPLPDPSLPSASIATTPPSLARAPSLIYAIDDLTPPPSRPPLLAISPTGVSD